MKRSAIILGAFFLVLTVIACDFAGISLDLGGGADDSNQNDGLPIEAGIDSPANGTVMQMGPVDISYHATSTEGVAEVELSIDGTVVSSVASPEANQKVVALRYTWNPPASGSHTLQARAMNKTGAWSNFATAAITVEGSQPPQNQQQDQQPSQATNTPESADKPEPTATPKDMTVYDVEPEKDIFYYGPGGCKRELTISAKITHPDEAYAVIMFIRLVDKEGEGTSGWDSGRAMSKKAAGEYSVTLFSESIPHWSDYDFSSMNYQIVVQDKKGNYLARSEVFKDVSLHICQ